jgi:Heterokaryon incompatibility protein (HET)
LEAALYKFRNRRINGEIWIDAICINQKDIGEKNVQVPLMGEIYASAACVIVWLGAGDALTDIFSSDLTNSVAEVRAFRL